MKIFDVFPFFNELDLLEIRLSILDPYVDHFVISEATKTFQGDDKPLYYLENKERFEKFNHKIIHNVVDDADSITLSRYGVKYNTSVEAQQRDTYQKDKIKEILLEVCDDDVIIWSDLDEVPNPDSIKEIKSFFQKDCIYQFAQDNYISFINLKEISGNITSQTGNFGIPGKWFGTKMFSSSLLSKFEMTELRNKRAEIPNYIIDPGGWHWSYVGSEGLSVEERLIKKIECSSHPELNVKSIKDNVDQVNENLDPFGRTFASYEVVSIDDNYPEYIIQNKEKFSYLIK